MSEEPITHTPQPAEAESTEQTWSRINPDKFAPDAFAGDPVDPHSDVRTNTAPEEIVELPPQSVEERVPKVSSVEEITAVHALILASHQNIVPELITGDSIPALIASIAPAQEAYGRITANLRIPAGGNTAVILDADSLTTFEKIRRGLEARPPR